MEKQPNNASKPAEKQINDIEAKSGRAERVLRVAGRVGLYALAPLMNRVSESQEIRNVNKEIELTYMQGRLGLLDTASVPAYERSMDSVTLAFKRRAELRAKRKAQQKVINSERKASISPFIR